MSHQENSFISFILSSVMTAAAVPLTKDLSETYCHVCDGAIDNTGCNVTSVCDKEHVSIATITDCHRKKRYI